MLTARAIPLWLDAARGLRLPDARALHAHLRRAGHDCTAADVAVLVGACGEIRWALQARRNTWIRRGDVLHAAIYRWLSEQLP